MTEQTASPAPFVALVAKNIRVHAAREDATLADVATGVGLDRASLYKRLSGEVEWRYSELQRVARYFGVPLTDIAPEDPIEAPAPEAADA